MRKQSIFVTVATVLAWGIVSLVYAQEGFGTNQPNKASVIDLTSASKGLLIPRVELEKLSTFAPIQGVPAGQEHTANSLLVYNTATVVVENLTPGYYYWDKPDVATLGKWVRLSTTQTPSLSQDLQHGTLTFHDGTGDTETYNLHWKLDDNGTGLAINNNAASGAYAMALGGGELSGNPLPNSAEGDFSMTFGFGNLATAFGSAVLGGTNNQAKGGQYSAVLAGSDNLANADYSVVIGGSNNSAVAPYEMVLGQAATTYVPFTGSGDMGKNRLFSIGNGTVSARSNAFTVLMNGKIGIGFNNFETTAFNERLQVNGNVRVSGLPTNSGNTATDKIVVADGDGILKTVAASSLGTPNYTRVFYMPSIVFDTSTLGDDLTRNLYNEYVAQFTGKKLNSNGMVSADPSDTFVASTGAAPTIPIVPNATDLYYYITDYDTTALANLNIDENGILTYDVIGTGTDYSLVNIVFVVKE